MMMMRCNSSPAMKGFAASLVMISMQVCLISAAGGGPSKMVRLVPAMYVLGDSTLDVGNNNYLAGPNVPRANMPLNGVDFPGGARATGRFSNGYNVADVAALYASLISGYSAAITDLYGMGARKFGIINVGLLGCVPAVRALSATGACNDGLNLLSAGFDDALRSLLAGLAARLPGLAYSLADSYNLTQATFANPAASGYVSIDSACCGSGRLGAESDCLPNSTLCADHDSFVFWDRTHPSQRAGELSAAAYFDGAAGFTAPISFDQLARKI